ncbi:hypothetical protein KPPK1082_41 [Klebsiella phage KPPK108.2]|nr:hypothetical protein KPPK1082_41 [Klebsiella phage KPPK108.2]
MKVLSLTTAPLVPSGARGFFFFISNYNDTKATLRRKVILAKDTESVKPNYRAPGAFGCQGLFFLSLS